MKGFGWMIPGIAAFGAMFGTLAGDPAMHTIRVPREPRAYRPHSPGTRAHRRWKARRRAGQRQKGQTC